ncbi:MAG: Mur ligase domain-containing protein [Candidatus Pacebacteria bacterium]|nr:Mur ligase domain-containing protein [Candidatus Paceibacterota bacterium]MCD8508356.1 Mur ligase domain-containing protein [Candidatus Paceibacterota bacterium]MCD8528369.1 Mur ligase domain-containing protein [Candidatus Paceibacterota bacterium]MCD8563668.1 Mur ligase domain-containing protein [Candidatus Paceibacterota bacterium]
MQLPYSKIHIIGIAGMGMTALATYLKEKGCHVTGSDMGAYDPSASYLASYGISFATEHAAENIPADTELIIIGKHAKLTMDNAEVAAAFAHPAPVMSMAEMWGVLGSETTNTLVVGSYGKSTNSALISWCLRHAGKDPHYFIGAIPHDMPLSHAGSQDIFIMEGDEYPTSNFDMTSKFMYLHGKHVLLTSGEHDHVNMFPTLESYLAPYRALMQTLTTESIVVANIAHPNVAELVAETSARVVTYGLHEHEGYHPRNIAYGSTTACDLYRGDTFVCTLETQLLGAFNIENIVGSSAMILEQGLLSIDELVRGIASFRGVVRRLDKKTDASSLSIYEGFGSSYTKAKTALEALRLHFPTARIVTVFEPHTFSWRDPLTAHWYDDVFAESALVIIYKPPAKDGKDVPGQLTLDEIVHRVTTSGTPAHGVHTSDEALAILEHEITGNEVILMLSSGELGGLIKEIPKWAQETYPQ